MAYDGIPPLHWSDPSKYDISRDEFIRGAEELGLNTDRKPIQPQQWRLADTLQAEDGGRTAFTTVGVCIPRRASKTTTILAVLLGRCIEREDYQVAFTAQSGTKARERFLKDLVQPLERKYGADQIPYRINRGRGSERITFENGSSIIVLAPIADNFRGDAYDAVFVDEAQEQDADKTLDLLGAILPTFDTRPGSQFIVAGTTGQARVGLLWDTLVQGRAGEPGIGIVEYAAPDSTDPDDYLDEDLWRQTHPGIDTLTTIEVIRRNANLLAPGAFLREYLGIWPTVGVSTFLDQTRWLAAAVEADPPAPPESFALAVAVHPNQASASIAAAWREDGVACVLLLDHRPGTSWLAEAAAILSKRYRAPVVYDTNPVTSVEIERLLRLRPKPRVDAQTYLDVCTAAALFMGDLDDGRLRHWAQPRLDEAARVATKRGSKTSNRWSFGRSDPDHDITPLEAASLALRAYDGRRARPTIRPSVAT